MRALVYKFEDETVVRTLAEAKELKATKGNYTEELVEEKVPIDKESDGSGRPSSQAALEALRMPKGLGLGVKSGHV